MVRKFCVMEEETRLCLLNGLYIRFMCLHKGFNISMLLCLYFTYFCELFIFATLVLFVIGCMSFQTYFFSYIFIAIFLKLLWYCTFNSGNTYIFQNITKFIIYFVFSLIKNFIRTILNFLKPTIQYISLRYYNIKVAK